MVKGEPVMRKEVRGFSLALWLMLLCALAGGCGNIELLDEVPRDFVLSWGMSEEEPEETVPEETPEAVPAVCFLAEGASVFARDSLEGAAQLWYRDMERILGSFGGPEELNPAGFAAGLDESDLDRIFQCVLSDHPELFYVEGYSYTRYTRKERLASIEFSGTYNIDLETALARQEEILEAVQILLQGIDTDASDYEKVKYVYDTLIRNTDYDLNAPDNQNIYSVFVHHFSVCQGYAKATQYLLNRLGVECTLVLGKVETGEGHAWNLVEVDGEYYYVDTTWGDVSYRTEEPAVMEGGFALPEINYDYLNVTTEELNRTHTVEGVVPMPECTAKEANYYVREGALFSAFDRTQLEELFRKAQEEGRSDVTVKCADQTCYREMADILIEERGIFDYLTYGENRIAYTQNEKQLSLTFWVTNE